MPKHFVLYLKKKIIFPLVAFIFSLTIILHFNGYLQINESLIILKTKQNFSKETEEYINRFDPHDYMMAGVDFFNPRYSPQRLNKPIEEVVFDLKSLKELLKWSRRKQKIN